ncbi:unnamed protein product, partial [Adineta ricciae]
GDGTQFQPVPQMAPQMYNNCTCLNIAGCPHLATFNDSHDHWITVPGMISDYLVLDGALASTFECYYNETVPITLKSLSNDSDKHFVMKSTIETLLNELMIDEMSIHLLIMNIPTGMSQRTAAHYDDIDVRMHSYVNQHSRSFLYPAYRNFHHFYIAPGIVHKPHHGHHRHRFYGLYSYEDDDNDDDERVYQQYWMYY